MSEVSGSQQPKRGVVRLVWSKADPERVSNRVLVYCHGEPWFIDTQDPRCPVCGGALPWIVL